MSGDTPASRGAEANVASAPTEYSHYLTLVPADSFDKDEVVNKELLPDLHPKESSAAGNYSLVSFMSSLQFRFKILALSCARQQSQKTFDYKPVTRFGNNTLI